MICKKCGSLIEDGDLKCPNCETPVEELLHSENTSLNSNSNDELDNESHKEDNSVEDEKEVTGENTFLNTNSNFKYGRNSSFDSLFSTQSIRKDSYDEVTPVNNNTSSNYTEQDSYTSSFDFGKSNYKKKKLPIILIVILLLIVGVGVGFYFYISTPMNVFKMSIDNVIKDISKTADAKTISGSVKFTPKLSSSNASTKNIFDVLNKIEFSANYQLDYSQKIANFDFSSTKDSKNLLAGNFYLENGYGYAFINGLYDKYFKFSLKNYNDYFEYDINKQDINIVINKSGEALKKALEKDCFSKKKEAGLTENTLLLEGQNGADLIIRLINNLLDDDEFLSSYAKIVESTKDEVKENLKNVQEESQKLFTDQENKIKITISIYTKGILNKVQSIKIVSNNNNVNNTIDIKDNTYKIVSKTKEEIMQFGITYDYTTKAAINKKNITNSKEISDLTDQDIKDIYENLMTNEELINFFGELSLGDNLSVPGLDL